MKYIMIVMLALFTVSCASGPIQVATNETEAVKSVYEDPQLKTLYEAHQKLLSDIYARFTRDGIDLYKEGIGFTTLRDLQGTKHSYLMVSIRPADIYFDQNSTRPEERLSKVIGMFFEKYLYFMRKDDLNYKDFDGLAFGVYWPTRDFSQCDKYGGFLEYAIIYFTKTNVRDYMDGRKTFAEAVDRSEVLTSLDLKPAKSVKPVF